MDQVLAVTSDRNSIISEALSFLRLFTAKSEDKKSLLQNSDLEPAERLLIRTGYASSTIPRLAFVGEFKSGKSTLINALLGGKYAATDVLEMTSWIARYWPAKATYCTIRCINGEEREVAPDDFRARCQNRSISQSELASIESVDIGIQSELPISIIDCPGLGSITRDNELRMIRAIDEADILVWVIDVDSIGGVREAGLIKQLVEHGMPIIAVLSKCDLLDNDSELEEIRNFVSSTYGIESALIFASKAIDALREIDNGEYPSVVTGIPQLISFFNSSISPRHLEMRRKSEQAHYKRIIDLLLYNISSIENDISKALEALSRYRQVVQHMCKSVQLQMEGQIEEYVRANMFSESKSALAHELAELLKSGSGALSNQQITTVFKNNLGERYFDEFWQAMLENMSSGAAHAWTSRLHEVQADIQDILEAFEASALCELATEISPTTIQQYVDNQALGTFFSGVKATLGVAGVATAYVAWLGPYAAYVTTGMAATGIGLPIAAIGAGVSLLLAWQAKEKARQGAELRANEVVNASIEHFIVDILRPHMFPKIQELNIQIGNGLIEGLQSKIAGYLPDKDLDVLKASANMHKQKLLQVMPTL